MAFFIDNQKIHFHKTYLDRVPKRYMPVYSGSQFIADIEITLNVRRNLQSTKFYWIMTFLGRTFVFWTECFDTLFLREFNQICVAYVSSYKDEQSKNLRLCSALTQKYSV